MIDPQAAVNRKLRSWQTQLLDLSRANRLLYYKPTRASTVPIVLPEPADLFQQLVVRGRKLTFPLADETTLFDLDQEANVTQSVNVEPAATMPGESTATEAKSPAGVETESLPPLSADRPAGEIVTSATASSPVEPQPATSPARKPAANEIGTSLTEQQSSRALYNLRSRARSALEEQGVNVLFVALGMLHWIDPATNESIRSPLLLVPVALNREALRKPYTLSMLEDDLVLNPTLAHKLETDFALKLPDIPDDIEEVGLAAYLDRIRAAIQIRSGWELTVEATLSTFSFQKINLYQDLETNSDFFSAHPLLAALSWRG